MRIEDENRTFWISDKHSPVHTSILKLNALGFEWIVLPQEVLLDIGIGELRSREVIMANQHLLRLNDCLLALQK